MSRIAAVVAGVAVMVMITAGISMADESEVALDGIGTLTVDETDGVLTLADQDLGEWAVIDDESTPDEIELTVTDGTTTVKVEVEIEDGELKTTLKDVSVPESDEVDSDHESGEEKIKETLEATTFASQTFGLEEFGLSVTVGLTDGALTASGAASEDWTIESDDDGSDHEVKVRFASDVLGLEVEFEAELEDGELKIEWEVEDESEDESDDELDVSFDDDSSDDDSSTDDDDDHSDDDSIDDDDHDDLDDES